MNIAEELRKLADQIEAAQKAILTANMDDMTLPDACAQLGMAFKSVTLCLEIELGDFGKAVEAEWEVKSRYTTIAKGTMAHAVREAIEKQRPHDVLERLEHDLGVTGEQK